MLLWAFPGNSIECKSRDDIVKWLKDNFNEKQQAIGIDSNNNLFEVFSSKNGSWTVLSTTPGGLSCIIVHGNYWRVRRNLHRSIQSHEL